MSNIITGDEPYYAFTVDRGTTIQINEGATIRQHAQLEFMKALAPDYKADKKSIEGLKEHTTLLTKAYIESLNK